MKSTLSVRVVGSAGAFAVLAVGLSACSKESKQEPKTSAEAQYRQEPSQQPQQNGSQGMENQTQGAGESSTGQNPTEQGGMNYRGSEQSTMQGQQGEWGSSSTGQSASGTNANVHAMSVARCDREVRCNNVGKDKKFEAREDCIQSLDDKGYECPSAIDSTKLDGCLQAIAAESCTNPLDTLSRLDTCRPSTLCMR